MALLRSNLMQCRFSLTKSQLKVCELDVVMLQLASCLGMTSRNITTSRIPVRHSLLEANNKRQSLRIRTISSSKNDTLTPAAWAEPYQRPEPEIDWSYLLNKQNTETIATNIKQRKGVGDIHRVIALSEQYEQEQNPDKKDSLRTDLISEALTIPNRCHPETIIGDESCAKQIEIVGEKKVCDFPHRTLSALGGKKGLQMIRNKEVSYGTGHSTYYFEADIARLEKALVNYTLDFLKNEGFEYITVPDLLYSGVINSCGFKTDLANSQVYHIHPDCLADTCLAGTSEMSLAGHYTNEVIPLEQLPIRVAAVSRCYRAEVSSQENQDASLYRVHHFTKVEMFGLTANEDGNESEELLEYFLDVERNLFSQLGLHFRILAMPSEELGAPAYKKYDIESWMHGAEMWGEISSCSNCTDYQSRRLNTKYARSDGSMRHVHTVNGTACAVPRMITTILEQNQEKSRVLNLPDVLQPYMDGQTQLSLPRKKYPFSYISSLRQTSDKML